MNMRNPPRRVPLLLAKYPLSGAGFEDSKRGPGRNTFVPTTRDNPGFWAAARAVMSRTGTMVEASWQSFDIAPPPDACAKSATPLADAKRLRASLCRDWYAVVWNKPLLTMLDTVANAINWLSSTALCFFSADAVRTLAAADMNSQQSFKV